MHGSVASPDKAHAVVPRKTGGLLRSIPAVVWVLLLTTACVAPFANKAFHIDDTLFLRAAEQILKHPGDFYGFEINWSSTTTPMLDVFENPPLTCYFIAAVARVFGFNEVALHLAFLMPTLAAAWGTFALARHLHGKPLSAAIVAVLTPVFLISATTLMCDMTLVAFWVWCLVLFEKGLAQNSIGIFASSGALAGLAVLTKFMALSLCPLLLAYGFLRKRKADFWLIAPLLPVLAAAGFEWLSRQLYGQGMLFNAAKFSTDSHAIFGNQLAAKALAGVLFTGGCLLPVLFYAPVLWTRRQLLIGLCALLPLSGCLLLMPSLASVVWTDGRQLNWPLFLQTALFFISGLHIFALSVADCLKRRDAVSLLLFLWIAGIFVFASFINWTINARTLLLLVPAVGILVSRRLADCSAERNANPTGIWRPAWIALPAAAFSLLLVKADYDLAGAGRAAAKDISSRYRAQPQPIWFEGHWGFQYYMEQYGAKPLDYTEHKLAPGEIVVHPAPASFAPGLPQGFAEMIEQIQIPSETHCSIMSPSGTAAFYCGLFGPLPFAIGTANPPTFSILRVVRADEHGELQRLAQDAPTDEEIVKYEKFLGADPNNAQAHFSLADLFAATSRTKDAIEHYRLGLQRKSDSAEALNNLAWILATDSDPNLRNGKEAVELAGKACALTHNRRALFLGTLAAAYAEAGRFEEATATATKAIQIAQESGQADLAATNRKLLQLYESSHPYHQTAFESPTP